jgi:spermidine/putrescine-binding protein
MALLLAAGLLVPLGCGRGSGGDGPYAGQVLHIFNWSDYLDPELVAEFEKRTGATVRQDNYSSDAELESKLLVGSSSYDLIFPSDRTMPVLRRRGQLAEIDRDLLPNWKNLDPQFLGRRFDPTNSYSVPYFWGTVAVGVRTDHVREPVHGFEVVFDERYKGRIVMLDDMEHAVAIALLHLGLPMNSTAEADLARARQLLEKQRPLVQAYTSDSETVKRKLIQGEAWVAVYWSGDILQTRDQQPRVRCVVPASGTMIWVDSMAIPRGAQNPRLAHAFIDFLLEPDIGARNANFVKYPTANRAARERIDPSLRDDPAIYPPKEILDRCQWLEDRGPAIARIEEVWQSIRR